MVQVDAVKYGLWVCLYLVDDAHNLIYFPVHDIILAAIVDLQQLLFQLLPV